MEDISVFINAFNEEGELPSLFENLKEFTDIVLIDHKSTDNTAKLAKKLGARVYTKELYTELVVEEDVKEFERRYGIKPHYNVGDKIWDGASDLNRNIKYCKNDWVLYIDCDERLTWDRKEVEKLLPDNDIIPCRFISDHNEDKTPKSGFTTKKLFRKDKTWFTCRIHTIVYGYLLKETFTDKMTIDHWQKPKAYRKEFLPRLEYAFLKEQSSRMNFYLAREYFHASEFDSSLKFFAIYLQNATNLPEIAKAYTLMSGCLWQLGKQEESFISLYQAMRVYPYSKMTFTMMANMVEMTNPEDAKQWRKFANILTEEHF